MMCTQYFVGAYNDDRCTATSGQLMTMDTTFRQTFSATAPSFASITQQTRQTFGKQFTAGRVGPELEEDATYT